MNPQGKVRIMSTEDVNAVALMDKSFYFDSHRVWTEDLYRTSINNDSYINYVYVIMNEIWSYVIYKISDDSAYAIKLISKPNGSLFAKQLIHESAKDLAAKGVKRITGLCQQKLVKYYEQVGVVVLGVRPHAFAINDHGYVIEMKI